MKIALAQMRVVPGAPQFNAQNMLEMIKDAKLQGADLVTFNELGLSGYLIGDRWARDAFGRDMMALNKKIAEASQGIAVAYGNVYLDSAEEINKRIGATGIHPNKDGRIRKYNAVYVVQNGKPVPRLHETNILPAGVQPKTLLPEYRIFEDERHFFSTKDIARDHNVPLEDLVQPFLIEVDGKKVPIGFELCEDLWCEDYRENGQSLNPTKKLIENGAKYIVNLSASPWTYGKNAARDKRVQFLKEELGDKLVPLLYANCVGVQNNGKNLVTFDGGSTVYNEQGKPVAFAKEAYKQELMVIDDKILEGPARIRREAPKIAQKYLAVKEALRGFVDPFGRGRYQPFVIGMSGGIDSAVVAAILTDSFGKDNVIGVNMPTKYNSQKTKDSAEHTARKLGIPYLVVPIEELVELNARLLNAADAIGDGRQLTDFNMENLQAKIRGVPILSNLAAKYNGRYTNNGNKLEVALGYATLDGDARGSVAPISDFTKIEIVKLAEYLNKEVFKDEVVPRKLIPNNLWKFGEDQIQPSAELKNAQIDPMKFVYHDALLEAMIDYKRKTAEDIMQLYADGQLHNMLDFYLRDLVGKDIGLDLMKRWGVDKPEEFIKDLTWFDKQMQGSVFKRVQSPPGIIVSKSAYGYDERESMLPYWESDRTQELKQKILAGQGYVPEMKK